MSLPVEGTNESVTVTVAVTGS
ncbi:MAG: hypothetical protein QG622_3595, partial [Actinomycetota bacterium]|nr:hypothetical protein [Actinomycetota bacterium]